MFFYFMIIQSDQMNVKVLKMGGMNQMKIVSSILPKEDLQKELIEEFPHAKFFFHRGIKEAQTDLLDAEVFITYGNDLTAEHILKAEKLRWIMVMSAGIEEMPLQACEQKGIIVSNARGIHQLPMAEYTIGIMLQYENKFRKLWENEQANTWDRKLPFGELNGKTIVILGTGAIGGEIARLAKAFQMTTFGMNRSGHTVPFFDRVFQINELKDILPKADYVVSILPSTAETKQLIREEHFHLMKASTVFCNIGRGDVVEEKVLLQALKEKKIAHAYLDVFNEEPLPAEHPFWQMENVTVTPHISSITKNYLPRAFAVFKHNLHAYINKEKLKNVVDIKKGY